jgi:hypothetical protein
VSETPAGDAAVAAHHAPRIAGLIYGTIVVLSVLVASPTNEDVGRVLALTASTTVVFWLAHVYAHVLGDSLASARRADAADVRHMAHRELPIVLAAVLPSLALVLGALDVLRDRSSMWLAFTIGVVTLVVQGLAYARIEHFGRLATLVTVGVNLGVALLLVLLKVVVAH